MALVLYLIFLLPLTFRSSPFLPRGCTHVNHICGSAVRSNSRSGEAAANKFLWLSQKTSFVATVLWIFLSIKIVFCRKKTAELCYHLYVLQCPKRGQPTQQKNTTKNISFKSDMALAIPGDTLQLLWHCTSDCCASTNPLTCLLPSVTWVNPSSFSEIQLGPISPTKVDSDPRLFPHLILG